MNYFVGFRINICNFVRVVIIYFFIKKSMLVRKLYDGRIPKDHFLYE